MSTEAKPFEAILAELAKPFDPAAVEFKPGAVAKNEARALALAYVDSREYMNRLDAADPTWSDAYEVLEGSTVICRLTVAGVTRTDLGRKDEADENSLTAAAAQAFKRACTKFGLGRYLYALPQVWAEFDPQRKRFTPAAFDTLRAMLVQPSKTARLPGGNGHHPEPPSNGNGSGGVKPEPTNGNGGQQPAVPAKTKPAGVSAAGWPVAAKDLAQRFACYRRENGAPDNYAILCAAGRAGIDILTDDNLSAVIGRLEQAATA